MGRRGKRGRHGCWMQHEEKLKQWMEIESQWIVSDDCKHVFSTVTDNWVNIYMRAGDEGSPRTAGQR